MRNSQNRRQTGYSISANIVTIIKELAIIVFLGTLLTLIRFDCAFSRDYLKCGDEVRIKTRDGKEFRGKLQLLQGNSLGLRAWIGSGLSRYHRIVLGDVQTAYRVKRHTVTGLVVGSLLGTAAGAFIGCEIAKRHQPTGWLDFSEMYYPFYGAGIGFFLGTALGGIIGYNCTALDKVQLEATPACGASSKDMFPVKLKLAFNF